MRSLHWILIFLLVVSIVHAAPSPWGIAINNETKECAGYWSGDEFNNYELPQGWTSYYPDFENNSKIIRTEYGECNFTRYEEEKCCAELKLEFVSDNIGAEYLSAEKLIISTIIILVIIISIAFLVVFRHYTKNDKL